MQKCQASQAIQRLPLCTFTAGGMSSIPGQGTKSLHDMQSKKKMSLIHVKVLQK